MKEFNHRVKGTEKFWNDPGGAEAIVTVRAWLLAGSVEFEGGRVAAAARLVAAAKERY